MLHDMYFRAKVVAYLSHLGYSNDSIAAHLNMGVATVNRALRFARTHGYLGRPQPVLKLPTHDLDAICPYVAEPNLSLELEERLEACGVRRVRVIPASTRGEESARRVAVAASDLLRHAIVQPHAGKHVLGVTWGRMLRTMIDEAHLPAGDFSSLILVPLSGEPSILPDDTRFERATKCSSNRLVQDLAWRLGLESRQMYSLRAPAAVTRAFLGRPDDLQVVWEMIELDPTVFAIFGPRKSAGRIPHDRHTPMLHRIDTLFTSVGSLDPRSTWSELGMFELHDGEIEVLRKRCDVVGDLNGHLLRKRRNGHRNGNHSAGHPVSGNGNGNGNGKRSNCRGRAGQNASRGSRRPGRPNLADELNTLAVSASPRDLRRIANRCRRQPHNPGLGVVLIAAGARKALPVLAACEEKAVNQLIISSDTAMAMLATLHEQPPS